MDTSFDPGARSQPDPHSPYQDVQNPPNIFQSELLKMNQRRKPRLIQSLVIFLQLCLLQPTLPQLTEPNDYCGKNCHYCHQLRKFCLECAMGYYYDTITKICQPCLTGCKSCTGPLASDCSLPTENYWLATALNNVSACNDANCAICNSATINQCFACKSGYILAGGACQQTDPNCLYRRDSQNCAACIDGFYLTTTYTCSQCVEFCGTCVDYTGCTLCVEGYTGTGSPTITQCTACPANYKNCGTPKGVGSWLDCNLGYFVTTESSDDVCKQCQTTCTAEKCNVTKGKACDDATGCKNGSFYDAAKFTCEECTVGAATCNATNSLTAINNYYINPANTPDVQNASRGCTATTSAGCTACDNAKTFYISGNSCARCSEGCTNCTSSGCHSSGCPAKFRHNSTDNTCEPCPYNCNACTGTSSECDASGCETNYWRNASTKLCEACTQGCNGSCSDTTGCTNCKTGWLWKTGATGCSPCATGCDVCTANGSCTTCKSGYYKDGTGTCNLCAPGCNCVNFTNSLSAVGCTSAITDSGYFYSSGIAACEENCQACSNATTCTKCDTANNWYLNSADCLTCGEGCSTCTDGSGCSAVIEGWFIVSNVAQICLPDGGKTCTGNVSTAASCFANYFLKTGGTCKQCPFGCSANCIANNGCPSGGSPALDSFYWTNGGGGTNENPIATCVSSAPLVNCKTCSSATTCTTCMTSNFYWDNTNCLGCSEGCTSCLLATPGCSTCNTAPTNYYHHNNTTKKCDMCMPGCQQCGSGSLKTVCSTCDTNNGWFAVTVNSNQICMECSDNCQICSDRNTCTTCRPGFWLQDKLCRPCPITCATCIDLQTCQVSISGYYLTGARKTAVCPTNCDTAVGSCLDGIGCQKCLAGSILSNTTGLCQPCPANCVLCTSTTNCVHCAANYFQSQGYVCAKCPANCATCSNAQTCATCMMYYFMDTDNKCQLCPKNCKNCTNATTCNAAQCIDGYFLSSGLCHKCPFGCQSCTNSLDCNTCTAGYYLTAENTCYPCWSNMPGCLTCSDHKTCLTCDTAKYYKMNYGNVVSCLTIDSGCEAGATADNLGCSKCKLGSYLVGNRCKVAPSGCALTNVSSACLHCHDGYYLGGGNTCALCNRVYPGCMKCDSDATTCRVCNKGFRLQGSKCEQCPLNCNYCQTTDKFTCDECRPGYWPKRELISSQVWITCQPCPGTCSTCSEQNYCTSCITGTYINADNFCAVCPANCGKCVDYQACVKCADGYYLTTSGVCELCSSECKECISPSSCHLCNTGFVLNGGGCDKCPYMCKNCTDREGCTECHDGFYVDPLTAMCLACTPNCLTCRSANNCITCDSHYYKNSLNGCSVCDTSCQTCTNSGKCRTCINNYFLTEGRTCLECQNGCLSCGSALDCHTSWETYYLNSENTPVICPAGCNLEKCSDNYGCTECGSGFFLTPPRTCQQADVNCKVGYVSDRIGCQECKSGFFISNMHAPQDDVNYICSDCTKGCATCNTKDIANPANTGCTARKSGYYLANKLTYPCDDTSTTCDTATNHLGCIDSYFQKTTTGDDTCTWCTLGCATCNTNTGCTVCRSGYIQYTNVTGMCAACPPNCGVCNYTTREKCLWNNCVDGFYTIGSALQCASCPNNCKSCTLTGTPPKALCDNNQCMSGFYKSGAGYCGSCEPNCETCSNTTTCSSCYPGYYASAGNCLACTSPCLTCQTTATTCLSCIYGNYQVGSSCAAACTVNSTGCLRCDATPNCIMCADQYYLNGTVCAPCITGCKLCTSGVGCVTCIVPYVLDTSTNTCIKCSNNCASCVNNVCVKCFAGFYLNPSNDCTNCGANCATCTSGTNCTRCFNNYRINGTACTQCTKTSAAANPNCMTCSSGAGACDAPFPGYWVNTGSLNTATACTVANCQTCTSAANTCTTCVDGFAKYNDSTPTTYCTKCTEGTANWPAQTYQCRHCSVDGKNCLKCPAGYMHIRTGDQICFSCTTVIANCSVCASTATCSSCDYGFYLANATTCTGCLANCKFCQNGTSCLRCNANYWWNSLTSACTACGANVDTCSPTAGPTACNLGYFLNAAACTGCPGNCKVCGTATACTTANDGYYPIVANPYVAQCWTAGPLTCLTCLNASICLTCYVSHYMDSSTNLCAACTDTSCKTCPNNTCTTCNDGFYLKNGACLTCAGHTANCKVCQDYGCIICMDGYFSNGLKSCLTCISNCAICTDKDTCKTCAAGYTMDLAKQCRPCMNGCITCTSGVDTCDICGPNHYLLLGNDTATCPACPSGCEYCSASTCYTCLHGYILNNGTCTSSCPKECAVCDLGVCMEPMPSYRIKSNGSIEPCTWENCLVCVDDLKQCDKCRQGFYYQQEHGCTSCDATCRTCSGSLSKNCVMCPPGRKMLNIYVIKNNAYWISLRSQSKYLRFVDYLLKNYLRQAGGSIETDTYCITGACPTGWWNAPITSYNANDYFSMSTLSFAWSLNNECPPWLLYNRS